MSGVCAFDLQACLLPAALLGKPFPGGRAWGGVEGGAEDSVLLGDPGGGDSGIPSRLTGFQKGVKSDVSTLRPEWPLL